MSEQSQVYNGNQGSIKVSEIATNEAYQMLGTAQNQDNLTVEKQIVNVVSDSLKKNTYILFSNGLVNWSSSTGNISLYNSGIATDITLRLLQSDDSTRTIDIIMRGDSSDSSNRFANINLAINEICYLKINRDLLRSQSIGSGYVEVMNGLIGPQMGAVILEKATMGISSGMPQLQASIDGSNTDTLNVPIAMRVDYTYNSDPYHDLVWIPHGIRWPDNTLSNVGEVIVLGSQAIPTHFVNNQTALIAALTALQSTGGVICITGNFTLNQNITVYDNIELIGRSWGSSRLTISPGVTITLGNHAKLTNIYFLSGPSFTFGQLVYIPVGVKKCKISDCQFELNNSSGNPNCIVISGSYNKLYDCNFILGNGGFGYSYRTGIYIDGSNNTDLNSMFE